ncbi:transmembrane protein 45B-like protein [Tanacetum coccineum]|uniref:Transmembrane protein 45B-like protein n=1 Tax=Tanacetum coccineum TaxID=301880 RepID=A0ABQ5FR23_9ASTR
MKSHDCHILMQRLPPYGLQLYLDTDVAKPIIELCSFFKQICTRTLMEDDMVKAESQLIDILCNLEQIYPPTFFDIMIYLVIHLLEEALKGRPIPYRTIGKRLVIQLHHQEMEKVIWEFPDKDLKQEFPGWFGPQIRQCYIDKDPSITDELFALACGPSLTPISVNSCVVNGVSLNNLNFMTLNIDGQSTDVEAPPDIIDVDDGDDFIDDEDGVPHDLADFDDEVLTNEDDDVAATNVYSSDEEMSAAVERGHGGDDDDPFRLLLCPISTGFRGVGGRKATMGASIRRQVCPTLIRKGKQRRHIPEVGRNLAVKGKNAIFIDEPRGMYTNAEIDEIKEEANQTRQELELLRIVVKSGDRMS